MFSAYERKIKERGAVGGKTRETEVTKGCQSICDYIHHEFYMTWARVELWLTVEADEKTPTTERDHKHAGPRQEQQL
jgi:hypothetical protein